MSESQTQPTFEEWLKKRRTETNEDRIRLDAYYDTSPEPNKWIWSWLRGAYTELYMIYDALDYLNKRKNEEDERIYRRIKTLLGMSADASNKDVIDRAKEFGRFAEKLIEKGREIEEEEKLREKMK